MPPSVGTTELAMMRRSLPPTTFGRPADRADSRKRARPSVHSASAPTAGPTPRSAMTAAITATRAHRTRLP